MNKTLLKRLVYEVFEDLAHLEFQVQTIENSASDSVLPYIKGLKSTVSAMRDELFGYRESLLSLFQEAPLQDSLVTTCMEQLFPKMRAQIAPLTRAVYRLQRGNILPETELFLKSLSLSKLLPDMLDLVVLPSQNNQDIDEKSFSASVLVDYLPVLAQENPLKWMGLLDTFSRHFISQTVQLASLAEKLNLPEDYLEILTPVINLRLLGPSYYSYYLFDAFERNDSTALWVVEPILFQGLNRFGLVNKDLVILHQGIERARQYRSFDEPKELTKIINNDDRRDEILKLIEKVVPERLAFTEKSFMRTQLLEERLANGQMLSAVPMISSLGQLRDDLQGLMTDEEKPIYPLLQQLKETPATPREIINAGWVYKLDNSSDWLQTILGMTPEDGWDVLKRLIADMDGLVLKSIEISEVHRVLASDELEHLVSV